MKKLLGYAAPLLIVAAFALASCAPGVATPVGSLFVIGVKHGDSAGPGTNASKSGRACANHILGIVATGDASIETAKSNGGVNEIAYVDHESSNYSTFYGEYCTVVKGS